MKPQVKRRAIGIVRVSVTGDRGERLASPREQRERLVAACERDGIDLLRVYDELDVSGGAALEKRPGLSEAVYAIEAGEADVVVAAYFDRLVRSLDVQRELVSRVETAGGKVMAVDIGEVSNASAGQWLSGTLLGAVSEYHRRTTTERVRGAQERAVARGAVPWSNVTPGYLRQEDGSFTPDPVAAPVVAQAFQLRADGATLAEVRRHLADNGIVRSYRSVQHLLASHVVLGEIHFGDLVNLEAHEPIVDRELWKRVQRIKTPRGRTPTSDLLLVRLGILRCGTCGSLMVGGAQVRKDRRYPFYRCCKVRQDCEARATISAKILDETVVAKVKEKLSSAKGQASAEQGIREAISAQEKAQADLDAALRAFAGLEDEEAARERLAQLRQARDAAQEKVDQLGGQAAVARVVTVDDWDLLTLEERRDLVRIAVERVVVTPGRGDDRVAVHLFGE